MKRMQKRFPPVSVGLFLLVALGVCSLTAGCAKVFFVADEPFLIAEQPPDMPQFPLRVAIVRTDAMGAFVTPFPEKERVGERLAKATIAGLAASASLVFDEVRIVDEEPTAGFDLVCLPTNPYFEMREGREPRVSIELSLEVVVKEPATGNRRSLLLSGIGGPGRRPAVPIRVSDPDTGLGMTAGVTGALVPGGPVSQAMNNALFYLSLDFAMKMQHRGRQVYRRRLDNQ